jgi:hypothetical protein
MTTMKQQQQKQAEQADAIATLKNCGIADGTTIYVCLKSVSKTGMSRRVTVYAVDDGRIVPLTYHVSKALSLPHNDNGVLVKGCGMDIGFWLVRRLSTALTVHLKHEWL